MISMNKDQDNFELPDDFLLSAPILLNRSIAHTFDCAYK